MTLPAPAAPLSGSAEPFRRPAAIEFVLQSQAIAASELRKMFRDPTDIFTRSVQPLLWLLVFGQVFGRVRAIPTGAVSYSQFLAPGILAQSVLFTSIFYGIAVIWERDLGIVQKMLVSPAYRGALVFGKAVAAGVRGVTQAAIVYAVTLAMGIPLRATPAALAVVVGAIMLGAALFSTFSLVIACIVKTRERFMGIGQLMTMPLFFASNAIYPIEMMPPWLQTISTVNPLTYLVSALRTAMLPSGPAGPSLATDGAVMAGVLVVLVTIAARLYPTVVR